MSRLLASAITLLAGAAGVTVAADDVEWIRGGKFEQGFGDFEVYRYPRYYRGKTSPVVSRVENEALTGRYSLLLHGLDEGGYRFVFPEYDLVAGAEYRLTFQVRSHAPVRVQVELFTSRMKNISRQTASLKAGDSRANFILQAPRDSSVGVAGSPNRYRVFLRIMSGADLIIDEFSLAGPGRASTLARAWVELTPDNLLGIYGIGQAGSMRVASAVDASLNYRIVDVVRDLPLTGNETRLVGSDGTIDLDTGKRGSYRVEIYDGIANSNKAALASRRYAVIDRERADSASTRYGIAMEEHGQKTQVDARIEAADFYRLAAEIGAGTVRVFTLAMPDIVSLDGIRYDFYQIDRALELCRQHDLDPLVELGSNLPNRITGWLRTSGSRPGTVDLTRGLATKKLKEKFALSGSKHYLDLAAYERYLREIFRHTGDKVQYFEIWNEPGHKFLPEDYLKIARLTRKVQQEYAPHSKLVGYTSTKSPGRAWRRSNGSRLPGFLDAMLDADHGESIDVLSYHSAHAFKFLEEGQDGQNDETGYVDLLRKALIKNSVKRSLPIWDTERGIPWASDRSVGHGSEVDSLEVARRLPGIHAASLASGVDRLFWFFMDSSTTTIAKAAPRYGFFDANLEPMPHLAAYDAMTQLIGDSRFARLIEREDGLKLYFFENVNDTIIMAFNWRRQDSSFNIEFPGSGYLQLDIMGNGRSTDSRADIQTNTEITVGGWPQYLVFKGSRANQIRVALQGH